MPWIETDAMQQRVLFIKAWLSRRHTKIELCKRFNISRPTADKWIERHEQVGFEPYADGIWHIYYRFHFLGIFDAREMKIKPATQWHIQPK